MSDQIISQRKKRCYSTISLILSLIGIGIIALLIVLGSLIRVGLGNILYPLSIYFGNNWINGPIIRVEFDNKNSCPVGSSLLLENIKFPAISNGCFCHPNEIYSGTQCSESQLSEGCINYPSSLQSSIYNWDYATPCAIRQQNENYFQLNLQTSSEACKNATMKSCGIIDSIGSTLCANYTESCPINYLKISNSSSKLNDLGFQSDSYELGENKVLVYSKEDPYGSVVNQFLIIDHQPCANELENILQFQGNNYECKSTVNGHSIDKNWILVDTSTLENLVDSNNLSQQMSIYPFYNSIKSENVYLYQRAYIGISSTCIQAALLLYNANSLPSLILNLKQEIESSPIDYISLISITLFGFLLIGLISRIASILFNVDERFKIYQSVILSFSAILLLIVGCTATVSISISRNYFLWFDSTCSDSISYWNIEELDSEIYRIYVIGILFTVFTLPLFLIFISDYLISSCDCCDDEPEEPQLMDYSSDSSIDENEENLIADQAANKWKYGSNNIEKHESEEDFLIDTKLKKNQ